jgi:hypothetical protein
MQSAHPILALHDERGPSGLGPVYTLTPEWLSLKSKGALGGEVQEHIPVAAIYGFYVETTRFVSTMGEERSRDERFLIGWRNNGAIRKSTWTPALNAPTFQALLHHLAQLRPDACLLGRPSGEAHRLLGMTSVSSVVWITMFATFGVVFLVVGGIILALVLAG